MNRPGFAKWLDEYKTAWECGDPLKAAALFTEDATYRETPFDETMHGRDAIRRYWEEGARDAQRNIRFGYEIFAVEADAGICRWFCTFERVPSGERVEFDGIFRCVFAADGRCREFREWWHRRTLPAGNAA